MDIYILRHVHITGECYSSVNILETYDNCRSNKVHIVVTYHLARVVAFHICRVKKDPDRRRRERSHQIAQIQS